MKGLLPLILGMTLVTFIPRFIPLIFLKDREINPKVRKFLLYIPFTSLSILITKGILDSSSDMLLPTFIGISVAGVASYLKGNLVLSVFLGIVASFIILNISF